MSLRLLAPTLVFVHVFGVGRSARRGKVGLERRTWNRGFRVARELE